MRLFEMQTRNQFPKKAGGATLVFDGASESSPSRVDDCITFPCHPMGELFPLGTGDQFLFLEHGVPERGIWFGGTDENPFLVRLHNDAFNAYRKGGEPAFYDSLKPDIIKQLGADLAAQHIRQGDMFLLPLPTTWKRISDSEYLVSGQRYCVPETVSGHAIFNTRHTLDGEIGENWDLYGWNFTVIQGTLSAPDHKPLKLKRPHAIMQAENLHSSNDVD